MKRRDLLVGFAAGIGFTVGNASLWQLADNASIGRKDADADGLALDEDPLLLGEEGISLPTSGVPSPVISKPVDSNSVVSSSAVPNPAPNPVAATPVVSADVAPAASLEQNSSLADYGQKIFKGTIADAQEMPELAELPVTLGMPVETLVHTHDHQDLSSMLADAVPGTNQRDRMLERVRNFDGNFADDIYLTEAEQPVLHSLFLRFRRAEKLVGHGNYNLLGFDQLFRYGRSFSQVGSFTPEELALIEKLFFTEAEKYGFYGEKVTKELTANIAPEDTIKIPASGHFLLRGDSATYYDQIRKDIGESVILTSGVRGNVKQMHLFVAKCLESSYNLSKTSRSLAPPGHSYHSVGDFDVGRVGWGYSNFTDKFAETDEFKRMQDLGYVRIRYTKDNFYGVRFEPWHIKVA